MKTSILLIALFISIAAGSCVIIYSKQSQEEKQKALREAKKEKTRESLRKAFYGKNETRFEKSRRFLSEYGVDYMMKREVNPVEYFLFRVAFASFLSAVAAASKHFFLIPAFFAAGMTMVPFIIKTCNKEDNKKMLPDIKCIYDTLLIKTEAGAFFTEALPECHYIVESKRLKKALLELNAGIVVKNNIEHAVYEFNRKFKNKDIDALCIIIRQALESGQTVQILNDMSGQMADIEKAINAAEKEKQEMQVMKVELLVYAMILMVVCFYVLSLMGALANNIL